MKQILTFMGVIFVLVGSIELVAFWSVQKSMSTYLEKEAIVTKVETDENGNRSVYVQYTIGDDIYREKLPTSASMEEGEKITIYYDSNNPHRIVEFAIKEAPLWVFILSGGIFALIGCIFLSIPIYISYKKKRIFSYHFIIYAKIEDVSLDEQVTINGRHPYRLEAQYQNPENQILYHFQSEWFFQEIDSVLDQYQIRQVPVYVNPHNYKEYSVDMSQIFQYLGK